jgi:hypothetical protein
MNRPQAGSVNSVLKIRSAQLWALHVRGDHEAAAGLGHWVTEHAREYADPEAFAGSYPLAAAVRLAQGDPPPGARALLAELSNAHAAWTNTYAANLATAIRAALAAGAPELAAGLAGALQPRHPLQQHAAVTAHALLAERHGQHAEAAALFTDAAARWKNFEVPWEQAQALLGQGRSLLALGQLAEARAPLHTARDIFATLRAKPALADVDRLLAQAATATA